MKIRFSLWRNAAGRAYWVNDDWYIESFHTADDALAALKTWLLKHLT